MCQAGFRRGRGVTDHLVKLGEHVGRAIGRRKILLTCFFDISRAYDQVWDAKLLQKLDKIGISGNMYNNIRSFLSDRSMQVRWKGATSTTKGVSMGVPQGSGIRVRNPPPPPPPPPPRSTSSLAVEGKGSADHIRR